ncbi:MAG: branched-chain amino acid transaminase [Acidobacteriota bacterium]
MVDTTEWIWHRGRWCRSRDATVHVTAHALHYGSSVYEGLRCYATPDGPAVFRLQDHIARFESSCRLLRMPLPYALDDIEAACVDAVRRNGLEACYIRPLAYRDSGAMGLVPTTSPVEVTVFAFPWGAYLGGDALEEGVDVAVSSWRRIGSDSLMPMGKIGGQYINNQLASAEAKANGFADAILLDGDGRVTEGAGQNLFLVDGEVITTPPASSAILRGITRDSVITLAHDLGFEVREAPISRESLYLADEVFMTGTASEITPVRSIDRLPVRASAPGEVTRMLQRAFFDITSGHAADRHGWLTPVADSLNAASTSDHARPRAERTAR